MAKENGSTKPTLAGRVEEALQRALDESHRRQAEMSALLEGNQAVLGALIENSADGIALLNADGVIIFASPSVLENTGIYSRRTRWWHS